MKQLLSIFIIFLLFFFSIQCNDKCRNDLLESTNRRIYAFNRGIDKILVLPVSAAYITFTPDTITENINNFYTNISEIQNLLLSLFFCNPNQILLFFSRIIINSTFGFIGFFDIAKKTNLTHQNIDFNALLNLYKSNYIMLPVLGPGTIKTNIYLLFTQILNPFIYIFNKLAIYYFLELIIKRSNLMFDTTFFHTNMFDGYSFLKDIYIQNLYKEYADMDIFLDEPGD